MPHVQIFLLFSRINRNYILNAVLCFERMTRIIAIARPIFKQFTYDFVDGCETFNHMDCPKRDAPVYIHYTNIFLVE